MPDAEPRPTIHVPGATSHVLAARGSHEGALRYLEAGTGAPLVLLHTVRTQAEHFRALVPLYVEFNKNEDARIGMIPMIGDASVPVDVKLKLPKKPRRAMVNAHEEVLARD